MAAKILNNNFAIREGMIVEFIYKDKLRRVSVERVVNVNSRGNGPIPGTSPFINGPELTDGGQIKSFTIAKIQGYVVVVEAS